MSKTERKQIQIENKIIRDKNELFNDPTKTYLLREEHVTFLEKSLELLPSKFVLLNASQPWILYWILHSLELLDIEIQDELIKSAIEYIKRCQLKSGGFGGGPGQDAHLGNTYAAICALCILGKNDKKAYEIIDRENLKKFISRCKNNDGSFVNSVDNEKDLRAIYCALSSATITHIYSEKMFEGTAKYISKCQTYEGGFGAVPGAEAHAGYTFCAVASLAMMDKSDDKLLIDKNLLLRWITHRQMIIEGGFQGRTCKLVDSCYSYWIGSIFYIMFESEYLNNNDKLPVQLFNRNLLQLYILNSCQNISGGLIDKPGKKTDLYHTCYALSGLSLAQRHPDFKEDESIITGRDCDYLKRNDPIYNICPLTLCEAIRYFLKCDPVYLNFFALKKILNINKIYVI